MQCTHTQLCTHTHTPTKHVYEDAHKHITSANGTSKCHGHARTRTRTHTHAHAHAHARTHTHTQTYNVKPMSPRDVFLMGRVFHQSGVSQEEASVSSRSFRFPLRVHSLLLDNLKNALPVKSFTDHILLVYWGLRACRYRLLGCSLCCHQELLYRFFLVLYLAKSSVFSPYFSLLPFPALLSHFPLGFLARCGPNLW